MRGFLMAHTTLRRFRQRRIERGGIVTLALCAGGMTGCASLPSASVDSPTSAAIVGDVAQSIETSIVDDPTAPPPMSLAERERRLQAIDLAAGYLSRTCGDNGRFVYRINLDPDQSSRPRYNMLRHAGTMYALGMHHELTGDPASLAALHRAAIYLRDASFGPVADRDDRRAVWSRPEVVGTDNPIQAKLGGAGLALVAMLGLERIDSGSTDLNELRGLARFIRYMQKEDGGFHSKYVPSEGGRRDDWTSLYYPGEAALGMVMLYEHDPDPAWLASAIDALDFLARSRRGQVVVPADHWALLATSRVMLSDIPESRLPADRRQRLVQHAVQVVTSILDEQVIDSREPLLIGGFSPDGRTTPTATRLEGLLAALDIVPLEQEALRRRMHLAIQRGMTFSINAMVLNGEHAGAMPRAISRQPDDGSDAVADFNRRAREVRIDYVQHALSAMIQYVRAYGPPLDRVRAAD